MKSIEQVQTQMKECTVHSEKNVFSYYASYKTCLQESGEDGADVKSTCSFKGPTSVPSIHSCQSANSCHRYNGNVSVQA